MLLRGGRIADAGFHRHGGGRFPVARYEEQHRPLEHGDLLVAYTDGIVEPENAYGEMFGEDRLKELVSWIRARGFLRDYRAHHGGGESIGPAPRNCRMT